MQIRNIRHFSQYEPGDVVEVPDGASYDPFHWEPVDLQTGEADTKLDELKVKLDELDAKQAVPAAADVPRLPYPAKEM